VERSLYWGIDAFALPGYWINCNGIINMVCINTQALTRKSVQKARFVKVAYNKLRGIDIMENILGELWMFKLMSIAGAVYLIYFFIKDRRGKKD